MKIGELLKGVLELEIDDPIETNLSRTVIEDPKPSDRAMRRKVLEGFRLDIEMRTEGDDTIMFSISTSDGELYDSIFNQLRNLIREETDGEQ